ncbi:MAG: MATE family efflux transporter, partial [Saprospiraceae bacterium]|nr:MATE family efflux transporter [Saprospiraceae bacterium]
NVIFLVQNIVVFKQISIYGDDWDIAFMGACYRILLLMLIPGFGFSTAVQPVIGINYGAGDYQRVKRAFFVFGYGCIGITSFLLILFEIFPVSILSLLLPNSTFEASDIFNFRIMMAPIFMSSLFVMAIIMYQSIGKAKISGIMTVLREIVFFIPVVILLPRWLGITGIYVAPLVQNLTVLFIILYLLRSQFKEWDMKFEKEDKEVN